jgi:hypothetical protein
VTRAILTTTPEGRSLTTALDDHGQRSQLVPANHLACTLQFEALGAARWADDEITAVEASNRADALEPMGLFPAPTHLAWLGRAVRALWRQCCHRAWRQPLLRLLDAPERGIIDAPIQARQLPPQRSPAPRRNKAVASRGGGPGQSFSWAVCRDTVDA